MPEQADQPLILIVDDHYPAVEMLKRSFLNNDYRVETAYNGHEALEKAAQVIPDLILLDVMMPGLSGYEVLEKLRQDPQTKNIPAIFTTAKTGIADIEHGLSLGADDYVPKPINPREIIARVRSKIEARRLRDALRQRTTDLEALLRVGEELNNQLEIGELLNLILYLVSDLIECEAAYIYYISEAGRILETRATDNSPTITTDEREAVVKHFLSDPTQIIWRQSGESPFSQIRSGMAVALTYGDQLHGVIIIESESVRDHQARLFEGIARQATLALRNAELYKIKVNYAEHLEEMVEERTQELRDAQALLVRSEKLASVGRLASGIAHEINNPLTPIIINLEGMVEDIDNDKPIIMDDVEWTLQSARRIRRIVERLLQFTRKQGDDRPSMEPLDVALIVKNVNALSQTFLRKSQVKVTTELVPNATVYGNRDQIEQVLLNLVLNAQAAMANGGRLHIQSQIKGDDLVLTVEDTGHGIDEALLNQIFEPFVSTKEDGTGLGLFVSYGIMENHSGTIDVVSEVGKGTCFTLTFPLIKEAVGED